MSMSGKNLKKSDFGGNSMKAAKAAAASVCKKQGGPTTKEGKSSKSGKKGY